MVVIDSQKRDSGFIEDILRRWCSKLGRERLARLYIQMSLDLSNDARQRSVPSLNKAAESIQLDENNEMKMTSKVLTPFFFYRNQFGVFLDSLIDETINGKEIEKLQNMKALMSDCMCQQNFTKFRI